MAFIDELNIYKNYIKETSDLKDKIKSTADKLGVETEYDVDTASTLLDKIGNVQVGGGGDVSEFITQLLLGTWKYTAENGEMIYKFNFDYTLNIDTYFYGSAQAITNSGTFSVDNTTITINEPDIEGNITAKTYTYNIEEEKLVGSDDLFLEKTTISEPTIADVVGCWESSLEQGVYIQLNDDYTFTSLQDNVVMSSGSFYLSGRSVVINVDGQDVAFLYDPKDVSIYVGENKQYRVIPKGTLEITEGGKHFVAPYEEVEVNVNVGSGINPEGTLEISNDGTYDVTNYATAVVNTSGSVDRLQWKCDNMKSLYYEFYNYTGTSLDNVFNGLDTSNVTNMVGMFNSCSNLTSVPKFDMKSVTVASGLFNSCSALVEIPELDTSKLNSFYYMFYQCSSLVSVPKLESAEVNDMSNMFQRCYKLKTVTELNMIKASYVSAMFDGCSQLENLNLKNIKKSGLTIGSGTSYGHKLTVDSLINTIKELWDYSSGSTTYTLTMGTTNKAKLTDVYVKLITPTAGQIEADPNIESKMPCVVCSSTDDGAMLITDYATLKKWTIA